MIKEQGNIIFVEDVHQYYVGGVLTPSVTTILSATVFKNKYSNIPQFVLDKAAEFGSGVHLAIETKDYSGLNDTQLGCIVDYIDILEAHELKEVAHETLLSYGTEYAGTADLHMTYQGKPILADIKTTSKLDLNYLSWQLSMYARALDFHGDLWAIWLPKPRYGKAQFVKVERVSDDEIDKVLNKYKEIENGR